MMFKAKITFGRGWIKMLPLKRRTYISDIEKEHGFLSPFKVFINSTGRIRKLNISGNIDYRLNKNRLI